MLPLAIHQAVRLARLLIPVSLVLCALFVAAPRAHAQDFVVTASSATAYTINGQPNPTLTLLRGRTYTFAVNTPGHPFFIKTAAGTGTGNQFTTGVMNNGLTSGTLTFAVPASAPATLFYQCSVHSAMVGTINVVSPLTVPSTGIGQLLVLLSLLLLGGLLVLRARRPARES